MIDAFFILLACSYLAGCEPAPDRNAPTGAVADRDAARLAADSGAVAELKRIDALLAARRPVIRLDIDSLERLRAQYPASAAVGKLLQGALIVRGDWAAVERVISEIPERQRTTADKLNLASVYLKQGRFADAVALLKTIHVSGPEKVEVAALLGQAQFYGGDIDAAAQSFESVRAELITQKRGDELALLGTIYFRRGDHTRAIEILQKAIELSSENISAHSALSRVYAAAGDETKAASIRAKLDAINQRVAADEKKRSRIVPLFYQLEDAYAAREFEKVLGLVEQIQPDADANTQATLHQYRAAVYKAQGKEAEANAALAEAAKLTQK